MANPNVARRDFLKAAAAGAALQAIGYAPVAGAAEKQAVGANEDLMREHGVLRRVLLVYTESAARLRRDANSVPPRALGRAADLFRAFGQEHHEERLEEMFVFPDVKAQGGRAAPLVDVLEAQHDRGAEITDYIRRVTRQGRIGAARAEPLASALDSFVLMYRNHAAREDTVVFPAWQESLSAEQLREYGERFEEIERRTFGEDAFDDAVKQIAQIEETFGLAELEQFTAPKPPRN